MERAGHDRIARITHRKGSGRDVDVLLAVSMDKERGHRSSVEAESRRERRLYAECNCMSLVLETEVWVYGRYRENPG